MRRLLTMLLLLLAWAANAGAAEESFSFGRFGKVTVYLPSPRPSAVVLFISGDGGWNRGVVDMARLLAGLDALVVGIDITHFIHEMGATREDCSYPAADLETLSKFVQKKYDVPEYLPPVLVGYSSGATLVYAALVQAPPNTFRGAMSLGFCPDLDLPRPLCRGSGLEWQTLPRGKGYLFLPAKVLRAPWIAFQGTADQVCDAPKTQAFVGQVAGGELVLLPKVGHGFAVQRNWLPQFKEAFRRLAAPLAKPPRLTAGEVLDLPLVEIGAPGSGGDALAVIISGDGGWAGIDRELGESLSRSGMPVVGLNSLDYFWKRRTPDEAATDLARILRHYLALWKKEEAILIGYSLGADVLPFMADRLPPDLLGKVRSVALLGPGRRAAFQFHLSDWIGGGAEKDSYPVQPEVERLKGKRILCFFGQDESDSLCPQLPPGLAEIIRTKGAHHFGGDYAALAEAILKEQGPKP